MGDTEYDYRLAPLSTRITQRGGTETVQYFDPFGRVKLSETLMANGRRSYVSTDYDAVGRVSRVTRPFFSGEAPVYTTFSYDELGRPTLASGKRDDGMDRQILRVGPIKRNERIDSGCPGVVGFVELSDGNWKARHDRAAIQYRKASDSDRSKEGVQFGGPPGSSKAQNPGSSDAHPK